MTALDQPIPWTTEELESGVPLRFSRIAGLLPDYPAIRGNGYTIRYDELDRRSNAVALQAASAGTEPGSTVVILLAHDARAVIAMLGALKAGLVYSVLDPGFPAERLRFLIDDLEPRLILAGIEQATLAERLAAGNTAICLIDTGGTAVQLPVGLPIVDRRDTDPAAVFYTSGSTGRPKGIARTHGMINLGPYSDTLLRRTIPGERQSSLFGYGFGASISDVFGALLTGSILCPYDFKQHGIGGLSEWLAVERISILHIPVALFRLWVRSLSGRGLFPDLRILHLGGHAITRQDVLRCREVLSPDLVIEHRLSTTETSNITRNYVDASTPLPEHILPAGFPSEGKEILIIDKDGRPLERGETGEIVVRSRLLSTGYWRRPDLSGGVFIPDPEGGPHQAYRTGDLGRLNADGQLEHLGRLDYQLKIRGYRVDLAGIEAVLLEQNGITEAVVVAEERPDAEPRLIAYLLYGADGPDLHALRENLGATLPEYMIPNVFVPVSEFPMTHTGKVDRKALPHPPRNRPNIGVAFTPPHGAVQIELVRIWEDVLGLDDLGADDPFFDLGGDSLSAARVLQRASDQGLGAVSLAAFYAQPTIAATAAQMTSAGSGPTSERSLEQALRQLEDF